MAKWEKVGLMRLSRSKKVVLVSIFELERWRWFIVDVKALHDLIVDESVNEIDVLESAA